jgi:hypothetical protein
MSDLLTHWAVYDDCRRLAATDAQMDPFINCLLDEKGHYARLGAIARSGSRWMPTILKNAYPQRAKAATDERLQQKIAFALGGLLHFPADYVFKPLMSKLAQTDWDRAHHQMQGREANGAEAPPVSIREISVYYDCHVFKKVYLAGCEEPFTRFLVADNTLEPGQALEAFVRSLFQRALLASHTLAPDMDNFDAWLDNLLDRVQPLYVDIGLYVEVFNNPDAQKMETYRVESDFYRDTDPIITLVRAVQHGEQITQSDLQTALDSENNKSGYATCLTMGVRLLREASAFWRGDLPEPPDVKQGRKK